MHRARVCDARGQRRCRATSSSTPRPRCRIRSSGARVLAASKMKLVIPSNDSLTLAEALYPCSLAWSAPSSVQGPRIRLCWACLPPAGVPREGSGHATSSGSPRPYYDRIHRRLLRSLEELMAGSDPSDPSEAEQHGTRFAPPRHDTCSSLFVWSVEFRGRHHKARTAVSSPLDPAPKGTSVRLLVDSVKKSIAHVASSSQGTAPKCSQDQTGARSLPGAHRREWLLGTAARKPSTSRWSRSTGRDRPRSSRHPESPSSAPSPQ